MASIDPSLPDERDLFGSDSPSLPDLDEQALFGSDSPSLLDVDEQALFGSDSPSLLDELDKPKLCGSVEPSLSHASTASGDEAQPGIQSEHQFFWPWDMEGEASRTASTGDERWKDALLSAKLLHDPDPCNTNVAEDRDWVIEIEDDHSDLLSPWMLRLALDTKVLQRNSQTVRCLAETLSVKTSGGLNMIYTDHEVDPAIVRIRVNGKPRKSRRILMRVLLHVSNFLLPSSCLEAPAAKRLKTSSSEHDTDLCLDAFSQELDCLKKRHKREMKAMKDKHEAEFHELTQRMTKRLLEEQTAVPAKVDELRQQESKLPTAVLTPVEHWLQASSTGEESNIADGAELLTWLRNTLQHWADLPAEERRRYDEAGRMSRELLSGRAKIEELDAYLGEVDAYLDEHGAADPCCKCGAYKPTAICAWEPCDRRVCTRCACKHCCSQECFGYARSLGDFY